MHRFTYNSFAPWCFVHGCYATTGPHDFNATCAVQFFYSLGKLATLRTMMARAGLQEFISVVRSISLDLGLESASRRQKLFCGDYLLVEGLHCATMLEEPFSVLSVGHLG